MIVILICFVAFLFLLFFTEKNLIFQETTSNASSTSSTSGSEGQPRWVVGIVALFIVLLVLLLLLIALLVVVPRCRKSSETKFHELEAELEG